MTSRNKWSVFLALGDSHVGLECTPHPGYTSSFPTLEFYRNQAAVLYDWIINNLPAGTWDHLKTLFFDDLAKRAAEEQ